MSPLDFLLWAFVVAGGVLAVGFAVVIVVAVYAGIRETPEQAEARKARRAARGRT